MSDSEEETVTDFGSVLQGELEYIYRHAPHPRQKERAEKFAETLNALRDPQQLRDAVQADPDLQLSGLAFSGGGIRSAAFGLGAIQSLARAGLISRFDFLSGVSGGGYILGWLLAWAYRIAGGLPSMERCSRGSA